MKDVNHMLSGVLAASENDPLRGIVIEWNGGLAVPLVVDVVVDVKTRKRYVRIVAETAPFTVDDLVNETRDALDATNRRSNELKED